jgi:hypothetical protein
LDVLKKLSAFMVANKMPLYQIWRWMQETSEARTTIAETLNRLGEIVLALVEQ